MCVCVCVRVCACVCVCVRVCVRARRVGAGERTPAGGQLDVRAGTSIRLNGGALAGAGTGLDLNLSSIPLPGQEGDTPPPLHRLLFVIIKSHFSTVVIIE